jgi:excisionase family DNA binding protein
MSYVRDGEVPELIDEKEVSRIMTISRITLRNWRCQGKGLPFVKMGSHVRYVKSDVLEYIAQHRCEPSGRAGSRTKDDTW